MHGSSVAAFQTAIEGESVWSRESGERGHECLRLRHESQLLSLGRYLTSFSTFPNQYRVSG